MNVYKNNARIVGILYIIGTAAGLLSLLFAGPILANPDYLVKFSENRNQVIIGVLFDLIMGIALAMVPIILFPIFRKYNEVLALGAVVFRGVLEVVTYMGIAISLLLLLSLSQEYVKAGVAEVSNLQSMGTLLLNLGNWFVQMTSIFFSIGALLIYYLFYQLKLIPRWLSIWGFIGAILYLAYPILFMFSSNASDILMIPLALQEMFMAIWLIVKGFNDISEGKSPNSISGGDKN